MNRSTAREIVMRLGFEAAARDLPVSELLDDFFSEEHYDTLNEVIQCCSHVSADDNVNTRKERHYQHADLIGYIKCHSEKV